jgi:hypothetical protein
MGFGKRFQPPMNADKRRSNKSFVIGVHLRLSAANAFFNDLDKLKHVLPNLDKLKHVLPNLDELKHLLPQGVNII